VHVVATPETTLAGVHASDDTLGAGVTVTVAVVLPPRVAVKVTVCGVATEPADAVNVVDVALAGTVTDAATGSAVVLLEASVTELPPAGAV
jgi:S-adenosylmethionine/arginine decarboxylase-like enzyme